MLKIDLEGFHQDLNKDPEFAHSARYWDSRMRLGMGEETLLLIIRDGRLQQIREYRIEDSCDVDITAPMSDWEKFLLAEPPPMYHSLYAVTFHHDFKITGNLNDTWAYMQALIRLFNVMRQHTLIS